MARRDNGAVRGVPETTGIAGRKRPPTSADVARLAGVSQATVSLVLNGVGRGRFSDETRDRVLSAAEALGYVPHAAASSLRSGHSSLVLITFLSLPTGPQLASYYEQVATELNALGYTVLFHVDRSVSGVAAARSWASLRPVGVIVGGERLNDDAAKLMRKAGVKAIAAMGATRAQSIPVVDLPGEVTIGRLAAERLVSTGRARLGAIVPREPQIRAVGLERLRGVDQAAREHGTVVQQIDLGLDEDDAARLVEQWKCGVRPDGVFTYNDMYAGLLLSALQDVGLRVPDDVALVGCDDLFMGQFLRPRLTTIRFPNAQTARWLATLVDDIVHDRSPELDEAVHWEPSLVVRDSA